MCLQSTPPMPKKFVFSSFSLTINKEVVASSDNGFIAERDLHAVFDEDTMLKGNLRKAPKLTYKALHPGNNEQNVNLALAIFHDTTVAACKSYFPTTKMLWISYSGQSLVDCSKLQATLQLKSCRKRNHIKRWQGRISGIVCRMDRKLV